MVNILFTEGFSCQRDLIRSVKTSDYLCKLKVFACHSKNRLEIFKYADGFKIISRTGELTDEQFIQEHLDYCTQEQITIVLTGQHTKLFEKHRSAFESKGIALFNGVIGLQNHKDLEDKLAFTARCQANDLPVVPAYKFNSRSEFETLHAEKTKQYGVMAVKPAKGVYASGFFQLDPDVNLFKSLTSMYIASPAQFAEAYDSLEVKSTYMLMPYFPGQECTVDVACIRGEIISAVVRLKQKDDTQIIEKNHECIELAKKFVAHFECDGLVGIQFIQNHEGEWLALEINARPSGGIGYSMPVGINIPAILIDEVLKRQDLKIFIQGYRWLQESAVIRPVTTVEVLS